MRGRSLPGCRGRGFSAPARRRPIRSPAGKAPRQATRRGRTSTGTGRRAAGGSTAGLSRENAPIRAAGQSSGYRRLGGSLGREVNFGPEQPHQARRRQSGRHPDRNRAFRAGKRPPDSFQSPEKQQILRQNGQRHRAAPAARSISKSSGPVSRVCFFAAVFVPSADAVCAGDCVLSVGSAGHGGLPGQSGAAWRRARPGQRSSR